MDTRGASTKSSIHNISSKEGQAMILYGPSKVQEWTNYYTEWGKVYATDTGLVLKGRGLKSLVLTRVVADDRTTMYKLRVYNKLPRKYQRNIEVMA